MSDKKTETPKVAPTAQESRDAELVKATAKAVSEEMLAVVYAMQSRPQAGAPESSASAAQKLADQQELEFRRSGACGECGQRKSGCRGEHELMSVYPKQFPQYADYFQGVFINGVRYLSNNAEHLIPVPKVAAGDIAHKIQQAENEEMIARTGRVKHHNSGDVSSPRAFNPAANGFR